MSNFDEIKELEKEIEGKKYCKDDLENETYEIVRQISELDEDIDELENLLDKKTEEMKKGD